MARESDSNVQLRRFFFAAIALFSVGIAFIVAMFTGLPFWAVTLPVGAILGLVFGPLTWLLISSMSNGLARLLLPHGSGTMKRGYSEQEALIARGEFAAAADSYRSHLVAFPGDSDARLLLADLLHGSLEDSAAAVETYLSVRASNPSRAQSRRVVDALIEIYRQSGDESGLRRELATAAREFPETALGLGARLELQRRVLE